MLTIVDYGVGNLRSVVMAFRRLGVEAEVTGDVAAIRKARALVLPGVGAFGDAVANLRALGLEETLVSAVADGVPFLGICVGLQLLFEVSEEMGEHRGLGILPGRVRRFPEGLVVPHMGWNQIHVRREAPLLRGLPEDPYAYFVHSYYVDPEDPAVIAATTDYGLDFCSVVTRDNLCAIQFHPEKSQDVGERILRNFIETAGLSGEGP
ncbi:MAG: imidazole glycerol phosphate synthase subunit HisH [Chloroflexi bacterium]|nr:imidazole glycerol phosphate synthase subunit HisH [Chloroflexota bacterium]